LYGDPRSGVFPERVAWAVLPYVAWALLPYAESLRFQAE
jgi:hypothetical protein